MLHTGGLERDSQGALNFLWLELTNQCNLQCTHCYAESGPYAAHGEGLPFEKYLELIDEAYETGCRAIQFIGGEPTLNRNLPALIKHASERGYSFIEVFTNLTRLPVELVNCFKQFGVHVATSVYAATADVHDSVTRVHGSFRRTIGNIQTLMEARIPVRAGVIEMAQNAGQTDDTIRFLLDMGVPQVGGDRLRHFGRGANGCDGGLGELCGGCSGGTLCVGSDGKVSPCIMSKQWSVGSVLNDSLTSLATSPRLAALRSDISKAVQAAHDSDIRTDICTPKTCGPYDTCGPKFGPGPCAPSGCNPCFPQG